MHTPPAHHGEKGICDARCPVRGSGTAAAIGHLLVSALPSIAPPNDQRDDLSSWHIPAVVGVLPTG